MVRKPKCLYCGAHMEAQKIDRLEKYNFWCPECGSESPVKDDEKKAYDAANIARIKKPLTLREVYEHRAVWIEHKMGFVRPIVFDKELKSGFLVEEYSYTWRAWLGYPSENDRKSAPWQMKI